MPRKMSGSAISTIDELIVAIRMLLVVDAVGAVRAIAAGQQAQLLVVAHGAGRGADPAGQLADPELGRRHHHDSHDNVRFGFAQSPTNRSDRVTLMSETRRDT